MLLLGLALLPAVARAQDAVPAGSARQHHDRGRELFARGQYEEALEELRQAERLEPSPELAHDLALVYEKLDFCREAIEAYRRWLLGPSGAAHRTEVEKKIAEQRAKLAHRDCKDEPRPPPEVVAEPAKPTGTTPTPTPTPTPAEGNPPPPEHHAFAVGIRAGAIFGRIGSSQELTGIEGYTPIEKPGGYYLRASVLLPLARAADGRPLLQAELFFGLAYYTFTSVTLVDASQNPLVQVTGGSAKLPTFGGALRASIALSPKWSFVPSAGGGLGIQMISLSTNRCDLSSSMESPLLSLDVPLRYDAEPHHAITLSPGTLYVIFPGSTDGSTIDAQCFGGPMGATGTPEKIYGLDRTKVNYAIDVGYLYQF